MTRRHVSTQIPAFVPLLQAVMRRISANYKSSLNQTVPVQRFRQQQVKRQSMLIGLFHAKARPGVIRGTYTVRINFLRSSFPVCNFERHILRHNEATGEVDSLLNNMNENKIKNLGVSGDFPQPVVLDNLKRAFLEKHALYDRTFTYTRPVQAFKRTVLYLIYLNNIKSVNCYVTA